MRLPKIRGLCYLSGSESASHVIAKNNVLGINVTKVFKTYTLSFK